MTRSLLMIVLGLSLFLRSLPVVADDYDDCIAACRRSVAPCIEQVKLTAGNIQEEENLIDACKKNSADCIQECKKAEANNNAAPAVLQEQPPQEQPPQEQPPQEQPLQEQPPQEQQ